MHNTKLKSILRKRRISRSTLRSENKLDLEATDVSATLKQRKGLTFAGPIQIIVVDPKSEYCKNVWCAIGIAFVNVTIGAVIMSVTQYSVGNDDYHAIICYVAYHFFTAEAILSLHYSNGWSASMRSRHRRFSHIFLHMCGIVCAIAGTTVALVYKGISTNVHGIMGIITGILVLLSALAGPFALRTKKACPKTLHMSLGIPTFIVSSLCVCFGLVTNPFKNWVGDAILYLLIVLVIFYTVFIVTSSFMKCVSRL